MFETNQYLIFSQLLLSWYEEHGRKNLPWQSGRTAYSVWVSEIMLQQTQVKTVIPYFMRFMARFPSLQDLATAKLDTVLALWSGLGYYSRARNLHKTAEKIIADYDGQFPESVQELSSLPGIGESTAAAIASLAFNQSTAILDANVKRVLSRYFLVEGAVENSQVKARLWEIARNCMPDKHCAQYTQAIMDMGATCCTLKNPNCSNCPLKDGCLAYKENRVAELPQKRTKKIKPEREQQFILLHKNNQIYLEKRPPLGIWGGLWSLPSLELTESSESFIQEQLGFLIEDCSELMHLKHSFTHFHLTIQARAFKVRVLDKNIVRENPADWFSAEKVQTLGLPKPVRDIILYFFQRSYRT